jgi:DNA-binding CsgD family transcriptional regulator
LTVDRDQSARAKPGRPANGGPADTRAKEATDAGVNVGLPGSRRAPGAPLSVREREILGLLAGGDSGAQIAQALVLSPETVRTHIRNAMSKLGASSRAQAVALAFQRNEIGELATPAGDEPAPGARRLGSAAAATSSGRARARADLAAGKSDATLTTLLSGLVSLYDVDGGTVFLAEEDGMSLRRAAVMSDGDENGDHHHPERVSLGQGTLGRAALERRAQLVSGSGSRGDARGRSTIYAPMISSGKLVGVICLTTRPSRLTARGELLLLQAFANHIGEILASGGADRPGRIEEALARFRTSWSSADTGS